MFELTLKILNGVRKGKKIKLLDNEKCSTYEPFFILENESIEFELILEKKWFCQTLNLYEKEIPFTEVYENEYSNTYIWKPAYVKGRYGVLECLFHNFFGIAELQVSILNTDGDLLIIDFQSIEILASKLTATRVESMFDYLSELSDEFLFEIFSATKKSSGYGEGESRPEIMQTKLEGITAFLEGSLPAICNSPITKLSKEYIVKNSMGDEYVDESTIAWLAGNLSVLESTDNIEQAIIKLEQGYYRASSLQVPVLKEQTDLYENEVVHGFIELLLSEAISLAENFKKYPTTKNPVNQFESYKSFFETVTRFSKRFIKPKLEKCNKIIERLRRIQFYLQSAMPVKKTIRHRPQITSKVRVNRSYLDVFRAIIFWHENGRPNWSTYEHLFGIKSIPELFEHYCYCRTAEELNKIFYPQFEINLNSVFKTKFEDMNGNVIKLIREPNYWTVGHPNSSNELFHNTEGKTYNNKEMKKRGKVGINSRRAPDIVIQVTTPSDNNTLDVLDAKYTTEHKAFWEYLPELTMKYVHGIHGRNSKNSAVTSLTILHPSETPLLHSFHESDYSFNGKYPVTPALQSLGLVPSDSYEDDLNLLLKCILKLRGITSDTFIELN